VYFFYFGVVHLYFSLCYPYAQELDGRLFESIFFWFEEQVVLHQFVQYSLYIGAMALYMLFFGFVWSTLGVDGHVIHVYYQPFLGNVVCEYGIHHGLKCHWGVGESEEHYSWFEEALVSDKRRFPLVSFSNSNIIVTPAYVEFGVQRTSAQLVDEFRYQWERVGIAYGPLVDRLVVLHRSKFSIFLLDIEETHLVGTFGRSDDSSFHMFYYEFVQFFLLRLGQWD
jgi:hypothetical protein